MSANKEIDPTGLGQHEPGAKLDDGKFRVDLVLGAFARALYALVGVGTFGAVKYTPNGWEEVEEALLRYPDAEGRHWLKQAMGQKLDVETGFLHKAHKAWNALASLELELREMYPDVDDFIDEIEKDVKSAIDELDLDT